ncbi:unnamed protein product [Brassicogethes aeneus]|uniref:UBA domain-containing protein n=1 Tax=Brassicogethes aeneus TaxID=1431903 RepID=A0A9P0F9X6_BRAAE|nr:unnamed protein product [Brassicogethes aeneus]
MTPPPLPPRKSSPTQEHVPTTSQNGLSEAQSVTNLTSYHIVEVPHISKSNSMLEMHTVSLPDTIEVSSSETICGVVIPNCENIIEPSQTEQQSCPSPKKIPQYIPIKSITSPNIQQSLAISPIQQYIGNNSSYANVELEVPPKVKKRLNPLERDAAVSYENLNIDYIKKLVGEGYPRDAVIKALGITRNNIDMACDILHEFGTKG